MITFKIQLIEGKTAVIEGKSHAVNIGGHEIDFVIHKPNECNAKKFFRDISHRKTGAHICSELEVITLNDAKEKPDKDVMTTKKIIELTLEMLIERVGENKLMERINSLPVINP